MLSKQLYKIIIIKKNMNIARLNAYCCTLKCLYFQATQKKQTPNRHHNPPVPMQWVFLQGQFRGKDRDPQSKAPTINFSEPPRLSSSSLDTAFHFYPLFSNPALPTFLLRLLKPSTTPLRSIPI